MNHTVKPAWNPFAVAFADHRRAAETSTKDEGPEIVEGDGVVVREVPSNHQDGSADRANGSLVAAASGDMAGHSVAGMCSGGISASACCR